MRDFRRLLQGLAEATSEAESADPLSNLCT